MLGFKTHRAIVRIRQWMGFTQIEIFVIIFIIGIMAAMAAPGLTGMLEAAKMEQATVELRSAFQETQRQSIRNNQSCDTSILIPASPSQSSRVQGACLTSGDRSLPEGIGLATNLSPELLINGQPLRDSPPPPKIVIHQAGLVSAKPGCYSQPSRCQSDDDDDDDGGSDNDDDDNGSNNDDDDDDDSNNDNDDNDDDDDDGRGSSPANEPGDSGRTTKVVVGFGRLGAANFNIVSPTGSPTSGDHSAKFVSFRPNKKQGKKTCVVLSRSLGLTRIGTYRGSLTPSQITASGKCQVAAWTDQ